MVILPDTGAERGAAAAERLRDVAGGDLRMAFGRRRISLGMSLAQARPEDTPTDVLARADVALYAAKRAGRDQVVHAG